MIRSQYPIVWIGACFYSAGTNNLKRNEAMIECAPWRPHNAVAYGVRRQSGASTPLLPLVAHSTVESAVAAPLCRRTPQVQLHLIGFILVVAASLSAFTSRAADAPLVGAIRWDAWEDVGIEQTGVEQVLGPVHWHYRLPFFAQVTSSNSVIIDGNNETVMDQEIDYAASAGLSYWAFVVYANYDRMSDALNLYLNSPQKNRLNFALILQGGELSTDTNNWAAQVSRYVGYFKDPSYQKVLGNRPLVYLLGPMDGTTLFPTTNDVLNGFNQLRAATTNAGLGAPYLVLQGWNPPADNATARACGFDAIGAYWINVSSPTGLPFVQLAAQAHSFWEADRATGGNVVPIVTTGDDNRPFLENPVSWYTSASSNYCVSPTPQELANHLADALNWTTTYQTSSTPANTVLVYAWNEHAEGGWLCPTVYTNTGAPDTSRLAAVRGVIPPVGATDSLLVNGSFETPSIAGGWYTVPTNGMPAAFGWSNNFAASDYVLANASALHFSAADDGSQALLLGDGNFLSQDTGLTAPDTLYVLTFGLLQDAYTPDPGGVVQAKIYDGTNLLASGEFPVPFPVDEWQGFALDCVSPHVPGGDLVVEFSGTADTAWLDNVSLSARSLPVQASLTNASFETPLVTNGWYVVPAGGMPSTFGWSNNFGAGGYVLANQYTGSFSTAAHGSQALLLSQGSYVAQDGGPADTNNLYRLTFSLLQDKYTPSPTSSISAQIFLGKNLLIGGNFTVPSAIDTWGSFTLTTNLPAAGELTIKFTGLSGLPWLDKVQLTKMPLHPQPWSAPSIAGTGLSNSRFSLSFVGDSGAVYYIQTSTNLTDWTSFPSISPAAYPYEWTDYTPGIIPRRFYRVQAGP